MDLFTATYSPEDNKLRLYAATRLCAEDYQRVKAAGFAWAPKQDLFVAPMWTPAREDLLIEMCGDVGDEDKSLAERAEERADRFGQYKQARREDSETARKAVAAISEHIPMGQPILVGHHSERHARKDAERIENGMRKAVKMWETSQYWEARARSAIRHAKYKESPGCRARRIKIIEADKRKMERKKAIHERALKFWNGGFMMRHKETGERRALEITESNREIIRHFLGYDPDLGHMPACKHPTLDQYWSVCDVLRPECSPGGSCPPWTIAQCQERAFEHYQKLADQCNRWIAHYDNRLAYERAMLAADGGTATDRKGPEVGGACKCWASPRGGWCYIKKVNMVSVTIEDDHGNGGRRFTRTIRFDELSAIMTAAEVQAARASGALHDSQAGPGFFVSTDLNRVVKPVEPPPVDEAKQQIDALKDALKAGVQVVSAAQLFPTPPDLATRMVDEAGIEPGMRILEPSAGTGNILHAIAESQGGWDAIESSGIHIDAVEINASLCRALKSRFQRCFVICHDFLEASPPLCPDSESGFDRIIMNPPFENGSDIKHIQNALRFLKPGGRLVAICANGTRQRAALMQLIDTTGGFWEDLPEGTFKDSGTMVNTALVVIEAPAVGMPATEEQLSPVEQALMAL